LALRPDSENLSPELSAPARNFIPGLPEIPNLVARYFSDDNDIHGSFGNDGRGNYFGHGRFSSIHSSTPILGGYAFEGTSYGRLDNINPFRGVAGGYENPQYNTLNTWNSFEISDSNRSEWDFGVSSGYNSAFAVDIGEGAAAVTADWNKLNQVMDTISRQAVLMKDNKFGFDRDGFHNVSGSPHVVVNPFSGTWGVDAAHPDIWESFGAGGAHPYLKDTVETQAPNYFEIIQSGAWSKWVKNKDLGSESAIRDSVTIANGVPDGEKFYYFLKSLLESKRRVLEAYRRILGPAKYLPLEAPAGSSLSVAELDASDYANVPTGSVSRVMAKTASASDWDQMLKVTRRQSGSIKNWYDTVAKQTDPTASFYNMLLFETAHTTFNAFDTLANDSYGWGAVTKTESGGVTVRVASTSYTEGPEAMLFQRAAVKAGFNYMMGELALGTVSAAPKSAYDTYVNGLVQERNLDGTPQGRKGQITGFLSSLGVNGTDFYHHGLGLAVKQASDAYTTLASESTDMSANNHIEIKRKLETLYQKQFAVFEEAQKIPANGNFTNLTATMQDISQKGLKAVNLLAPIAELLRSPSRDSGVNKMRTPILGFDATSLDSKTGFNDLSWDFIPHSILTTDNTVPMYDGYVTMAGTGTGYSFGIGRRQPPVMVSERPPILDDQGRNTDANAMMTVAVPLPDGDEYALNTTTGTIQSVNFDRAFSANRINAYYVHSDARGHLAPAAPIGSQTRWRGQVPEVQENPAFSGAAFTYISRQGVAEEQLLTAAYNWNRQTAYRREVDYYDQKEAEKKEEEAAEQRAVAEEDGRNRQIAQTFEAARRREAQEREHSQKVADELRRLERERDQKSE
jgi:hypothetical protein